MKVCMVGTVNAPIPRIAYGGIEECVLNVSHELAELGCEVDIVTVKTQRKIQVDSIEGVCFHPLMEQSLPSQPLIRRVFNRVAFGYKVSKFLEKNKDFDLIHLNVGYSGWKILLKKHRIPIIRTVHTGYPWLTPWRSIAGSNSLEKLCLDLDDTVEVQTSKKVDMNVAVGSAVARKMVEKGISSEKIRVIINGVDTKRFGCNIYEAERKLFLKKHRIPNDRILFLFLGMLRVDKGVNYLLLALRKLVENPVARRRVFLFVAGDGPELPHLMELSSELGLSKYVSFLGRMVGPQELPKIYSYCDVYVLPSLLEAMPLTALEALASGKPVIMTDIFGKDLIENDNEGFLVPRRNVHKLCEAMSRCLDKKLRRKMGSAAFLRARKYDWRTNAKQLLEVYESLA